MSRKLFIFFFVLNGSLFASELFMIDPKNPFQSCPLEYQRAQQWLNQVCKICDDEWVILACSGRVATMKRTERKILLIIPPSLHWLELNDGPLLSRLLSKEEKEQLQVLQKIHQKIDQKQNTFFPL